MSKYRITVIEIDKEYASYGPEKPEKERKTYEQTVSSLNLEELIMVVNQMDRVTVGQTEQIKAIAERRVAELAPKKKVKKGKK